MDLAVIALLGSVALFATRCIGWEEAERRIYWNIVLMYGGAIALGIVIDRTGAARWLVDTVLQDATIPPTVAVAAVAMGTLVLSEFMSNVAAVAVMLPLAFNMASQLGASPVALTLATSIGAGLDFALPFSSAPNTIVFSSGYLRMVDVVKAGGAMTIVSILLVVSARLGLVAASGTRMNTHNGATLWFTGLPSSGKSTIAREVFQRLLDRGLPVELLDGAEVRESLSRGLSFSKEDREEHIRRMGTWPSCSPGTG